MPDPPEPVLAVVIPCLNGADTIARQLDALLVDPLDIPWEVVVADNGSTDGSRVIAEAKSTTAVPVRVADASHKRGINAARNAGVRSTSARWILLCDVDDVVDPGWVRAYVDAFNGGAKLVGGPVRKQHVETGAELEAPEDAFVNNLGYLPWPHGANSGFTREVFDQIGVFDESFLGGGDETDFFWRAQLAGYELVLVSDAMIAYSQRSGLRATYRQNRQFGRSHVRLFALYANHGMPRTSARQAAIWWLSVPLRVVLAILIPRRRRLFAKDLGVRVGRVRQSLVERSVYL